MISCMVWPSAARSGNGSGRGTTFIPLGPGPSLGINTDLLNYISSLLKSILRTCLEGKCRNVFLDNFGVPSIVHRDQTIRLGQIVLNSHLSPVSFYINVIELL